MDATTTLPLYVAGVGCSGGGFAAASSAGLQLSRAKHASLTGHSRMARRVARLIPFYEYDEARFFRPTARREEIAAVAPRRLRAARRALPDALRRDSAALTGEAAEGISDLQFTAGYRVPFQFSRFVREHLKGGALRAVRGGVTVTDLDGNEFYDLTGSYGVNVFGYDFYKECIAAGRDRVARRSARCSAPIIRWSPTMCAGCARFPGSTKSRSTCPAPRR